MACVVAKRKRLEEEYEVAKKAKERYEIEFQAALQKKLATERALDFLSERLELETLLEKLKPGDLHILWREELANVARCITMPPEVQLKQICFPYAPVCLMESEEEDNDDGWYVKSPRPQNVIQHLFYYVEDSGRELHYHGSKLLDGAAGREVSQSSVFALSKQTITDRAIGKQYREDRKHFVFSAISTYAPILPDLARIIANYVNFQLATSHATSLTAFCLVYSVGLTGEPHVQPATVPRAIG